ncbi:uncharacterized protein [Aristolochia californica]|uniref:uncharacterized protein n=1 Tax=Aristolochia californica TaxID=171875 RepID=UPI0035DF49A2
MESDDKATALRFKSLAVQKYNQSNLKSALKYARRANRLQPDLDDVPEMVTAFKILRLASEPSSFGSPNYYKILDVEPFSHINSIKKRYKMLALLLHPDKNSCLGAEEAFKHVGEAFRVLSDRVQRKEYDVKLRVALQSERSAAPVRPEDTFWTACTTCRLLHQFERRYVGHRLICPSCKKSFLAVEVDDKDSDGETQNGDGVGEEASRTRVRSISKLRVSTERKRDLYQEVSRKRRTTFAVPSSRFSRAMSTIREAKRTKHEMTLAEMQKEAMRKAGLAKGKLKKKPVEEKGKRKEKEAEEKAVVVQNGDSICMLVEDSDFYEFDMDRTERCFKKGQVWAIYDDDDGMPRHYGLIDEVISIHRFMVRMKWLDVQSNGDQNLLGWEKLGFHISCGRFKVGRELDVESVNMFSHVMDCDRVAREIYRIYPLKGSVWAIYRSERPLDDNSLDSSEREGRSYDIVIFLTSYSELHGLSMAYLEKVGGFKTIFKRKEIGAHSITWFEKDDVRLFSHQIPARKLSGDEAPDLPKECWELDPASLPADLLRITDGS